MMKRTLDVFISAVGLVLASPFLGLVLLAVWLQDGKSPFYIARRAGRGGTTFRMVKIRSMVVNADKSGVNSTSATDARITPVGRFVRAWKIDEFAQLWNVLKGDMSLVGPRPQVVADTLTYTQEEQRLLSVRPGITDAASIVFADEGDILKGSEDADLTYNRIIRPWKSRLALLCIDHASVWVDFQLLVLTGAAIVSRPWALRGTDALLRKWEADHMLRTVASRVSPLPAYPPPGANEIITACG